MAELSERPFPPGDWPVVVVGSGPGGLQVSYALRRLGVDHAILSADEAPGGMFRRWPFFQRLLSWTKPYAPFPIGSRAYERFDWNSLIPDDDEHRAIQPTLMDGSSYFPSRPEMEASLAAFAERTAIRVRYGCRWESTRRLEDGRFELTTSDGVYTAGTRSSSRSVWPNRGGRRRRGWSWSPITPTPGRWRPTPIKRVFIIGKQNSGFELASGFLPWARKIIVASPSPAKLSVQTHSLVGIRARYVQPYEDHVLGGGVAVLDAAIETIERGPGGDGFVVRTRRSDGAGEMVFEVDEVIAATGFVTPLRDLPDLGVATFGQSRLPAQTPFWESATTPGVFFAGTIGQGSKGLMKHGIPANSGAVQGARYNARVLARHIAETRFGVAPERPLIRPADLGGFVDRRADPRARDLAPARLPGPGRQLRAGRRDRRRRDPAAGLVRGRERARRPGDHPRDRRLGRPLPGPLQPARRPARGASSGRRPAPRLRDREARRRSTPSSRFGAGVR